MLIISQLHQKAMSAHEHGDQVYKQAQLAKMRSIQDFKEAGDHLKEIRDMIKRSAKPVITDLGTFEGWEDYMDKTGWKRSTANDYIRLAENWEVVVKLGMQDESRYKNCLRLHRTLKVIEWYNKGLAAGRPESELTLEQYWLEQEAPKGGPTKKELEIQLSMTKSQLEYALQTIERLEKELAAARRVAPKQTSIADIKERLNTLKG